MISANRRAAVLRIYLLVDLEHNLFFQRRRFHEFFAPTILFYFKWGLFN